MIGCGVSSRLEVQEAHKEFRINSVSSTNDAQPLGGRETTEE